MTTIYKYFMFPIHLFGLWKHVWLARDQKRKQCDKVRTRIQGANIVIQVDLSFSKWLL